MPEPVTPLLFLHLPKTAGTTLKSILERVYAGHKTAFLRVPLGEYEAFAAKPEAERAGYGVVTGHIGWRERGVLPGASIITVLREPVERMLSWYHYNKSNPNARLHRAINEQGLTLEHMARRGMLVQVGNGMVDMLRDGAATTMEAAVESAVRNLSACAAFGLQERFDETVGHFAEVLRWPATTWESLNVSRGRARAEDLDPGLVAAIKRSCAADVRLYERARRLFEERVGG